MTLANRRVSCSDSCISTLAAIPACRRQARKISFCSGPVRILDILRKRPKLFRIEAMRAGFFEAWQERDYAAIAAVAEKIPDTVLQEDQKLLLWYDQALTRMGADA